MRNGDRIRKGSTKHVTSDLRSAYERLGRMILGKPFLLNSNSPRQIGGPVTVTVSDLQSRYLGEGNTNATQLFVDPSNGDYHLKFGAPYLDGGTSSGLSTDFEGSPLVATAMA